MRALLAALLLGAAVSCSMNYNTSGPYMRPAEIRDYRLARIAEDPSDPGAKEALKVWVRRPEDARARTALLACLPEHLDAIEGQMGRLLPEQLQDVFSRLGEFDTAEVNGFIIAQLPSLQGRTLEIAYRALAGRQSPEVLRALISGMKGPGEEGPRVAAALSLSPAQSAEAKDALTQFVLSAQEAEAVRAAAARALAPIQEPALRAALLPVAQGEDSAVAARLWDGLGAPGNPKEREAAIIATGHQRAAASAARSLDREAPLSEASRDAIAALLGSEWPDARWAAAESLGARLDLDARAALVGFFDDAERRPRAYALLDLYELDAPEALRAHAEALSAPEAKALAAELLARQGGAAADGALLVRIVGKEAAGALAPTLRVGPGALFPDGIARFVPWPGEAPVALPLREAIAWHKEALERLGADPSTRYALTARVVALGARSEPWRQALAEAAQAAQERAKLHMNNEVSGSGYLSGDKVRELVRAAATAGLTGVELGADGAPGPHRPYLHATGAVRCSDDVRRDERATRSMETHSYTVPNPDKQIACDAFQRYAGTSFDYQCEYRCTTESGSSYTMDCDASFLGSSGPVGNCNMMHVRVPNPEYASLKSACEGAPDSLTQSMAVSVLSRRTTTWTDTRCEGTVAFQFDGDIQTADVQLSSTRTRTERVDALDGSSGVPEVDALFPRTMEDQVSDPRDHELAQGLAAALSGFSLSAAELQQAARAGHAEALRAGDAAATVELELWANPGLIADSYEALGPFAARFLREGDDAFPGPL